MPRLTSTFYRMSTESEVEDEAISIEDSGPESDESGNTAANKAAGGQQGLFKRKADEPQFAPPKVKARRPSTAVIDAPDSESDDGSAAEPAKAGAHITRQRKNGLHQRGEKWKLPAAIEIFDGDISEDNELDNGEKGAGNFYLSSTGGPGENTDTEAGAVCSALGEFSQGRENADTEAGASCPAFVGASTTPSTMLAGCPHGAACHGTGPKAARQNIPELPGEEAAVGVVAEFAAVGVGSPPTTNGQSERTTGRQQTFGSDSAAGAHKADIGDYVGRISHEPKTGSKPGNEGDEPPPAVDAP